MFLLNLQRVKITLILISYESEIKVPVLSLLPLPFGDYVVIKEGLLALRNGTGGQVTKL